MLKSRFEVSTVVVGDGREEEVHETKVLNRISRMDHEGWHYEADQRHGQLIVNAGLAMKGNIFADSSAALGIAKRRGSGKMGHVKIGTLWIQEKNETGELQYTKVQGDSSPADLMTNNVNHRTLDKMAALLQQHFKGRRAENSLQLQLTTLADRQRLRPVSA